MKIIKISILVFVVSVCSFLSCSTEKKEKTTETVQEEKLEIPSSTPVFKGEFIHVDTAAVLKGASFIYGVKIDETAKQLIQQVNDVKNDEYDVINVVVKGELSKNTGEGWEEIITITSVEKVYPPQQVQEEKVIKYSSQKSE
jgi:hypothetical protein